MADAPTASPTPAIKSPPVLVAKTQAYLSAAERLLGGPVLSYWNSDNGSICSSDVPAIHALLKSLGEVDRLYFLVKSGGGFGEASLRIVHLLRQYAREIVALVPLNCQSAATMLALGADKILMGPLGQLSAVDTSLRHPLSPRDQENEKVSVSQDSLARVLRLWREQSAADPSSPYRALYDHIHPLVIGAVDRASALSTRLCIDILSYHMDDREAATRISNILNSEYPSHTYPITLTEAARIGLKVDKMDARINEILLDLNNLYSEMGQRAHTDFDAENYHDSSVLNIIELAGAMIFYQNDTDWRYRTDERRWIRLNDNSFWRRATLDGEQTRIDVLHLS